MLGLVAMLLCLLGERVLPRLALRGDGALAVLRLQLAMAALAGTAWRQMEAGRASAEDEDEMLACAEALRDALLAVLVQVARAGRRPALPAGRRIEGGAPPVLPSPPPSASVGLARARDGPDCLE